MERLAETFASIPGVVAVTLGGSRGRGEGRPDSDWDFGLYYRDDIDVEAVRALGFEGEIVEPGAWGRLVNGGAWLTVDGERVDLLYRDIAVVEHWTAEASRGRFEVDLVEGYVAGMATYILAGELALAKVLVGDLPRPAYPEALRMAAAAFWQASADFSLKVADNRARAADTSTCAGLLAKAALAAAQARLAERGEWALNEKAIIRRANLGATETIIAALGASSYELGRAVFAMRVALGLGRPRE
jgi:predicted nucleotidyltransferase